MKPGYKTTEFWLTFLAQMLAAAQAAGIFTGDTAVKVLTFAMATLATLGYVYGRAYLKATVEL